MASQRTVNFPEAMDRRFMDDDDKKLMTQTIEVIPNSA